jgi:hypothetical protein
MALQAAFKKVLRSDTPLFAVRYPPFCCPLPPFLLSDTPLFLLFGSTGSGKNRQQKNNFLYDM